MYILTPPSLHKAIYYKPQLVPRILLGPGQVIGPAVQKHYTVELPRCLSPSCY